MAIAYSLPRVQFVHTVFGHYSEKVRQNKSLLYQPSYPVTYQNLYLKVIGSEFYPVLPLPAEQEFLREHPEQSVTSVNDEQGS